MNHTNIRSNETKLNDSMKPINTSVVILSAGHGKRMLPLTKNTPKPLLKVGKLSLIEHHLLRLKDSGFENIIINIAYLGEQIRRKLGDGSRYGLSISYSDETDTGALETAGGLKAALPLISSDSFIVINADIWTDFDFSTLLKPLNSDARLVMVPNPEHNSNGDFGLSPNGKLTNPAQSSYTFSGIAMYTKKLFTTLDSGKQALAPVFKSLITQDRLEGVLHTGLWMDIGTPERLNEINRLDRGSSH